ncbi:energy transducer TonB [Chryseobacterium foetidum]|uniref:energy transducer TonB n=1 Tax=Chryseobacterium foetidum TaxID=2951057 RepID=UPI0021C62CB7|nr:energy transducer TonB [Chryseobacterium foetidum]
MMKNLLQILLILSFVNAFGQQTSDLKIGTPSLNDSIYTMTEQAAEFPGGLNKFRQGLSDNFDASAIKGKGQFSCELSFVILENGQISNLGVTGNDIVFNNEAIRALGSMKNKVWKPGKINGELVKSRYKIPFKVTFE